MLQAVYWTGAEARTGEVGRETVTVVMWDWDTKHGKAVPDRGPHRIVDVYMTDYSECDLTVGVNASPVPTCPRKQPSKGGDCEPV
jgi:hypothetical protein